MKVDGHLSMILGVTIAALRESGVPTEEIRSMVDNALFVTEATIKGRR